MLTRQFNILYQVSIIEDKGAKLLIVCPDCSNKIDDFTMLCVEASEFTHLGTLIYINDQVNYIDDINVHCRCYTYHSVGFI